MCPVLRSHTQLSSCLRPLHTAIKGGKIMDTGLTLSSCNASSDQHLISPYDIIGYLSKMSGEYRN